MKKLLLLLVSAAGTLLFAGSDLRVQNFSAAAGGKAEVISLFWKTRGLKLTADETSDVRVTCNQFFTYRGPVVYEVSADIKGNGTPFVEFQFFNTDGTPCGQPVAANVLVRGNDMKALLDLRNTTWQTAPPRRFKVIIGVKQGGILTFDDIELDVDDD